MVDVRSGYLGTIDSVGEVKIARESALTHDVRRPERPSILHWRNSVPAPRITRGGEAGRLAPQGPIPVQHRMIGMGLGPCLAVSLQVGCGKGPRTAALL